MTSPNQNAAETRQKPGRTAAEPAQTMEQRAAFVSALKLLYDAWSKSGKALTGRNRTTAFVNAMNDAAKDLGIVATNKDSLDTRSLLNWLGGGSFPQWNKLQCLRKVFFPTVTDGQGETADVTAWREFTALWRCDGQAATASVPRTDVIPDQHRKSATAIDAPLAEAFGIAWNQTRAKPFDEELVDFRFHDAQPCNGPDRHNIIATLRFGEVTREYESATVHLALRAAHLNIGTNSYQVAHGKLPGDELNQIPHFTPKGGGAVVRPPPGSPHLDGNVVPDGLLTEIERVHGEVGPVTFEIAAARNDINVEAAMFGSESAQEVSNNRQKALKVLLLDQCGQDMAGRAVLARISLSRQAVE